MVQLRDSSEAGRGLDSRRTGYIPPVKRTSQNGHGFESLQATHNTRLRNAIPEWLSRNLQRLKRVIEQGTPVGSTAKARDISSGNKGIPEDIQYSNVDTFFSDVVDLLSGKWSRESSKT